MREHAFVAFSGDGVLIDIRGNRKHPLEAAVEGFDPMLLFIFTALLDFPFALQRDAVVGNLDVNIVAVDLGQVGLDQVFFLVLRDIGCGLPTDVGVKQLQPREIVVDSRGKR